MDGNSIEAIAQRGVAALRGGDAMTARCAFEDVERAGRASPRLLLMLHDACRACGDEAAAGAALDRLLAAEPRNIAALVLKGDHLAAASDDRAASSWYGMALSTAAQAPPAPELATFVARARDGVAAANARFEAHLQTSIAGVAAGAHFDEALAIVTGRAQPQLQQPTSFYYPGLPQTAFYDPAAFDWVPNLEAATLAIRAELEAVLATGEGFAPYVEADPTRPNKGHALLDSDDWSAFHLYAAGEPHPVNAARCPATMAALSVLPLPRITGRSPMALFSLLRPATHIPPHWGMLNTRLIVHLPLIVPTGCRLRVGNHVRDVVAGQAMIFDDSIEHEAWNDSSETRVVLLFEVWRPELSSAEREGLTQMFGAIGSYGVEITRSPSTDIVPPAPPSD